MVKKYRNPKGHIVEMPEGNYLKYKDSIFKAFVPLSPAKKVVIKPVANESEIEDLRNQYEQKFGKKVSNKFKNNQDWLSDKINN